MLRLVVLSVFTMSACTLHSARPGDLDEVGLASYYSSALQGSLTASGEPYRDDDFTAAHRTLPFGTCVRVTAVSTGRFVEVRVNDRGPHVGGRVIDLSRGAAVRLGLVEAGMLKVRLSQCVLDRRQGQMRRNSMGNTLTVVTTL